MLSPQNSLPRRGTKDDLVTLLETKLEHMESQLLVTKASYSGLQSEFRELQEKFGSSFDKYKKAALIMTEFLDDALKGASNDFFGQDLHLDVDKM